MQQLETIEAKEPEKAGTNEIEKKAVTVAAECAQIVVVTREDCERAASRLQSITMAVKSVVDLFAPMKKKAFETHREITSKEKSLLDPLENAKKHLSSQIGLFHRKEEEARIAAERKLQQEAQEQAKKQAAEEAQRREELAIRKSAELEAQGKTEEADKVLAHAAATSTAIQTQAQNHVPIVHVPAPPKIAGVSIRQTWKFEIVSPDLVPREYLIPDERAIRARVQSLKDKCSIPGVRVWCEDGAASRG
ncbi:MAG: hypothetical protein KGJ13_07880 [Patescibacteria group bacterium]|nr:hypothetical protein [Patescibacteria group bacterium]